MKIVYVFIILSALIYTEAANNLWTAQEYQITIIELSHENEHEGEEDQSKEESKIYHFTTNSSNEFEISHQLLADLQHRDGFITPYRELHSPPPEL